jgi:hypothetical protein
MKIVALCVLLTFSSGVRIQAQTITMQILPQSSADKNFRVGGIAGFSVTAPPDEAVWTEDALPAGAVASGDRETWTWVSSNPTPYSGNSAHQSIAASGLHQHYFTRGSFTVNAGEALVTYIYLDPENLPSEVMLQWNDGNWEHRVYWGQNLIGWGINGTSGRYYMGALPEAGRWVRLDVPASLVGLEGHTINGMAFTLYGGRATWDHAGKFAYSVDKYRVYGQTSLPRGRWTANGLNHRDYYLESLNPNSAVSLNDPDNCSIKRDPRLWNARCIDNVVLLTKNIACNSNTPLFACQNNDYWNGYPGRSNMSTFPTRPPLDDSGFGWPSNNSWGVKNFPPLISKDNINNSQQQPPPTGAVSQCHPNNPYDLATGTGNSKVTQVKFPDGTSRWFMAFNSQIHDELSNGGFSWNDNWRMQWAYSDDGKNWTVESRPLVLDVSERSNCWQGILVTDMFVDTDNSDPNNPRRYFYIVATTVLTQDVWLFRSPVLQFSTSGYDTSWGWEVRGGFDTATAKNFWIRIPPSQLGTQINLAALGAKSITPSRASVWGNVVKQTVIGRVFASPKPNGPSKYLALTVDKEQASSTQVLQLWATDDLSKPFVYQSDVADSNKGPFGGYGFEMSFLHYPDNDANTPRMVGNEFEVWFTDNISCEGLANCNPSSPPGYRGQSKLTVSRRRARLSGSIFSQ